VHNSLILIGLQRLALHHAVPLLLLTAPLLLRAFPLWLHDAPLLLCTFPLPLRAVRWGCQSSPPAEPASDNPDW